MKALYTIHNGHYFGVHKDKLYGPYNSLNELQNRVGSEYTLYKTPLNKFKKYYIDNPKLWKHRPVFYSDKKNRLGMRSIRAKLNPGKRNRSPEKKFLDFTQRKNVKTSHLNINIPNKWIFIGNATEVSYLSDKWDGKKRLYKHILKKHGKILIDPSGKQILIVGLNLNIKKEGLTG